MSAVDPPELANSKRTIAPNDYGVPRELCQENGKCGNTEAPNWKQSALCVIY